MENKEIYVYLGLIRIAILKNTDLEVLKYFILDEATKEDMAATQPSGDMIAFGMGGSPTYRVCGKVLKLEIEKTMVAMRRRMNLPSSNYSCASSSSSP